MTKGSHLFHLIKLVTRYRPAFPFHYLQNKIGHLSSDASVDVIPPQAVNRPHFSFSVCGYVFGSPRQCVRVFMLADGRTDGETDGRRDTRTVRRM